MNDRQTDNKKKILVIQNLYKSFGNNHVLKGINFELYKEENVVVMGRSGSGKSILIFLPML